jgi:hypothetical protein
MRLKITSLALATTTVLGSVIGVAFLGAGSASAASYGCVYKSPGVAANCVAPLKGTTTLFLSSGGTRALGGGVLVEVTCYYRGSDAIDGYWDHVVWNSQTGDEIGHVNDSQVNFDNQTPKDVGLQTC